MDFFNRLKNYFIVQNTGKDFEHEKLENWVLGIIYFNRNDFRFMVPKQNPMMGWTFNFAHPIPYLFFGFIGLMAYISSKL